MGGSVVGASDLGPKSRAPVGAVVFFGKTLNYHSATLVLGDNLTKCCEVTCDGLLSHPGGVEILLVASYYSFLEATYFRFKLEHVLALFWSTQKQTFLETSSGFLRHVRPGDILLFAVIPANILPKTNSSNAHMQE